MKYKSAKDQDFIPVPIINVSTYNHRVFNLSTLAPTKCLKLIQRMKTGAPSLYNTIHNDSFVKCLITNFNAEIIIPMKKIERNDN